MKKLVLVSAFMATTAFAHNHMPVVSQLSVASQTYVQGSVGGSKMQFKDSDNEKLKDNSVALRAAFGQDSGDVRYAIDYTRFGQLKATDREVTRGTVNSVDEGTLKLGVQSVGVSLYRDFNMNSAIVPYVGARVGVNRSKFDVREKTTRTETVVGANPVVEVTEQKFSESKTAVGAGVQAGMQYHLNPQVAVDLGLEYNHLGSFKFKESDGEKVKIKGNQAGVNVGVRYSF